MENENLIPYKTTLYLTDHDIIEWGNKNINTFYYKKKHGTSIISCLDYYEINFMTNDEITQKFENAVKKFTTGNKVNTILNYINKRYLLHNLVCDSGCNCASIINEHYEFLIKAGVPIAYIPQ